MPRQWSKQSRVKTRNSLTPQQKAFVEAFFEYGGNVNAAGLAASEGRNEQYGHIAMQNEKIREYVQNETLRRIESRLMPLTHWALERILTDPKTPGAAVVAATKLVWETAGVGDASKHRAETGRDKEISEMTVDEMERELARLRDMADRRIAQTSAIDIQPESEPEEEAPEVDPFA